MPTVVTAESSIHLGLDWHSDGSLTSGYRVSKRATMDESVQLVYVYQVGIWEEPWYAAAMEEGPPRYQTEPLAIAAISVTTGLCSSSFIPGLSFCHILLGMETYTVFPSC